MEFNPGPEIISRYFHHLTLQQQHQFASLAAHYGYWNERINVISRKDLAGFYQNHVLHSLGLAKVQPFEPGQQVLDLGTGGGFPGIPLAILFPETRFHLIDSIGKKIRVVQEVIDVLGLQNASSRQIRAEEHQGKYNLVVCRAVTRLNTLIKWTRPLLSPGGQLLCLKGGNLDREIAEVQVPVEKIALSECFIEPFFETKKVLVIKG